MSQIKIIAFEGIDGSGKGLQFDMLCEKMSSTGKKVLTLSFPMYDGFFGQEIGAMLSGKNNVRADEVDAKSMALWYAVDRYKSFQQICLQDYDYLLLNRYTLSNAVFQALRSDCKDKNSFAQWVFALEHQELSLPRPDLYIILDVDEDNSKKNVAKKGFRDYTGYDPDVYEKSESLMRNARDLYLAFAKTLPHVCKINCVNQSNMLHPDEIHQMIWENVIKI